MNRTPASEWDTCGRSDHVARGNPVVASRSVRLAVALLQGRVVLRLVLEDQALHRCVGEERVPAREDEALP